MYVSEQEYEKWVHTHGSWYKHLYIVYDKVNVVGTLDLGI
jgi:hypothetical protein